MTDGDRARQYRASWQERFGWLWGAAAVVFAALFLVLGLRTSDPSTPFWVNIASLVCLALAPLVAIVGLILPHHRVTAAVGLVVALVPIVFLGVIPMLSR